MLRFKEIFRVISIYLLFLALALCVPLLVASYYEYIDFESHPQPHSTAAFAWTILICLVSAFVCYFFTRGATKKVFRREGIAVVVLIWFITGVLGGLPFLFSGTFSNPIDACFETISGLTTTGATCMHPKKYNLETGKEIPYEVKIIENAHITSYSFYGTIAPVCDPKTGQELYSGIEAVSKGVIFWRSFLQWLGGMGIVVLMVAVLPALGVGGRLLFQAEASGPMKDAITPRIKETAGLFWKIYLGLTIIQAVVLYFTNDLVTWFDAVVVAFSTLSTGGFSSLNSSIGGYKSAITDWIVIVFMIAGSINFTHYVQCLRGKVSKVFGAEFLLFFATIIVFSCATSLYLVGQENELLTGGKSTLGFTDAFRYGVFQLVSAQTSTGFATANFDMWPYMPQIIMLIAMFVGGMAGSTSGGIKIIRIYLLFQMVRHKIESIFRPEAVRQIRVGGSPVSTGVQTTVLSFFVAFMTLSVLGTLFYVIDGIDVQTALSLNACMINNVGLAFGMAGPMSSCAFLSPFSKMISIIWMVLGRLELFALLILCIPAFWRARY